jgi:hypothetical protein
MDYLSNTAAGFAADRADTAGKLALTVVAAGRDVHDFGGIDIVHVLTTTHYSPSLGAFSVPTNTWHQAWAMLGLAAAGEAIPVSVTQNLIDLQQADGGWMYDLGPYSISSDADSTGIALQALAAAGVAPTNSAVSSAILYLESTQDGGAGWLNANSTVAAVQGLLAAGEDLESDWLVDGRSPMEAVVAYQKSDGPFVWKRGVVVEWWGTTRPYDDLLATADAIPALYGVPKLFVPGVLAPFAPSPRGLDPDRTLAVPPRFSAGDGIDLVIPFGSDANVDGDVTVDWRPVGLAGWFVAGPAVRVDGYYTASLPSPTATTEYRVTFHDMDGVQHGSELGNPVSLTLTIYRTHLPLILR